MTEKWKAGKAANKDRRVTLMRSANTKANYKHGMGGLPKGDAHKPKPVTLPRMPWDDDAVSGPQKEPS